MTISHSKKVFVAGAGSILDEEINNISLERYEFTLSSITFRSTRDSECFSSWYACEKSVFLHLPQRLFHTYGLVSGL